MPSLRRRLLAVLLTTFAAVWATAVAFIYFDVRDQLERRFDEQLAQTARVLWLLYADGSIGNEPYANRTLSQFGVENAFQVWDGRTLLARSANAPEHRMADGYGATSGVIDGEPWRFFYRVDALRGLDVIVGNRMAERRGVVLSLVLGTVWPLLAGLPVLALLVLLAVTQGLRPLRRLADDLSRRGQDVLEPVDEQGVPREIQPVVGALNGLLERLDQALERERRFTADASHELRTPLAALKTQAQAAQRAHTDLERQQALTAVIAGVDRASRLVEQLLTLARLDPEDAAEGVAAVDLEALAAEVIADADAAARARGVEVVLQARSAPAVVEGRPGALAVLIRNLLDNAIRHSPRGGTVTVGLDRHQDGIDLTVRDQGPGIPPPSRARVFDRFHRLPGTSGGSGLGLSIVARIAELHEARIVLEDPPQGPGLLVRVQFADGLRGR